MGGEETLPAIRPLEGGAARTFAALEAEADAGQHLVAADARLIVGVAILGLGIDAVGERDFEPAADADAVTIGAVGDRRQLQW